MRLFTVVLWCVLVAATSKGYVISRRKREVLIQSIDPSESDVENSWYEVTSEDEDEGRTLLTRKREERKVLLELYYLGKILRAYRRPWAFGSPVFKSALERITNKELLEQLERKLRKVNGFEEISRIGADGTVPDQMHVQLANDYRLLAPIMVRTLRKILGLKHGTGGLDINDKDDVIGELLRDQQREWLGLQQAVRDLKGDGVVAVVVPEKHITAHKDPVYFETNELDVIHPAAEEAEVYEHHPVEELVTESENDLHQEYQWADVKEPEWEQKNIQWGPRPHSFDSEAYYNLFPGYKPSSSLWASVYGPTDEEDGNETDDTESSIQAFDEDEPVNLIDDKNDVLLVDLEPEVVAEHEQIPEDMVFESLSGHDEDAKPLSVQEAEVHVSEEVKFEEPVELSADSDGDIPEDMVVDQFVSGDIEEDGEEEALVVSSPEPVPVDEEQPVEPNPAVVEDIPEDMVFGALIDTNEESVDTVTEVPWLGAETGTHSNGTEDIPEDMVLGALVDTTDTAPYDFSDDKYANAPTDEIEGRRNNNRRRQQLKQQQQPQQVPVVIIQQSTTVAEVTQSPTVLNEQIERAARELIAIELDKFLLLVEELSGVDGVSQEFDRTDRTRMIGWVNQDFSPAIGLDQRDLVKALFKLLNTKELSRGRVDLLAALEFLQSQLESQLENQAREEKIAPKEAEPKEDDYFARYYGVNGEAAEDTAIIETPDEIVPGEKEEEVTPTESVVEEDLKSESKADFER